MRYAVILLSLCLVPAALAQEPLPSAVPQPVPPAMLMMVKDGVFELPLGKSMDMTDRKILLSFPSSQSYIDRNTGQFREGRFVISLNGDNESVNGGSRIDLKKFRATQSFVDDMDVCVLDIVELIQAKGASARAIFRLHCQ